MSVSLDLFDQLIAETEHRIAEQASRVMTLQSYGEDTTGARRQLRAFEAILAEYRYVRTLIVRAQRSTDGARRVQ